MGCVERERTCTAGAVGLEESVSSPWAATRKRMGTMTTSDETRDTGFIKARGSAQDNRSSRSRNFFILSMRRKSGCSRDGRLDFSPDSRRRAAAERTGQFAPQENGAESLG